MLDFLFVFCFTRPVLGKITSEVIWNQNQNHESSTIAYLPDALFSYKKLYNIEVFQL